MGPLESGTPDFRLGVVSATAGDDDIIEVVTYEGPVDEILLYCVAMISATKLT